MMDRKQRLQLETRARILKALGHPTRLFIAETLEDGAQCVCALTAMVGVDMSTISRHLAILKQAGIVRDEKRGAQVIYSLRATGIAELLDCAETIVRDRAQEYIESSVF